MLTFNVTGRQGALTVRAEGQIATGVTVLFGASGAGKSSLLRMLAGFLPCDGVVRCDEQVWQDEDTQLAPWERRLGMVFQQPSLFEHLTVEGNLRYAQARRSESLSINEVANLAGIAHLLERNTTQLSGGEAQRVALARALIGKPKVLLLDEPMSAIDYTEKKRLIGVIRRVSRALPVLYVTHSFDELFSLADWVMHMQSGCTFKAMPLAEALTTTNMPSNTSREPMSLLAERSDACAVLSASALRYDSDDHLQCFSIGDQVIYTPSTGAYEGDSTRLRIFARDVSLALSEPKETSILNVLRATVLALHSCDEGQVLVQLKVNNQSLLARVSQRSCRALSLHEGKPVFAMIKAVALVDGV